MLIQFFQARSAGKLLGGGHTRRVLRFANLEPSISHRCGTAAGDHEGATPGEAAVHAARTRLRPILMTSFAFILGVAPLAVATGAVLAGITRSTELDLDVPASGSWTQHMAA